jgi:hypothetical protein
LVEKFGYQLLFSDQWLPLHDQTKYTNIGDRLGIIEYG